MNQQKNRNFIGGILIFIGGALWGMIGPCIQIMEQLGSDSILTSFLRVAFAFVIMLVLTVARYGIRSLKIDRNALLACALLGLICHGIYNIFYSLAVNLAGITISAVLLNIAPLFTALFSWMLFHEHITSGKLLALVINIFGCVLAATGGNFSVASFSLIGIVCGIIAGLCYGLTAIFGKIAGEQSNAFVMSTYSYLFAAIFLFFFSKPWQSTAITNVPLLGVGFFYALVPTAVAYLLYYQGVQNMQETSRVPVLASIEMVMAGIFGVMLFHEQLHGMNLLGMVLVLLSIVLMSGKAKQSALK
jgi:drug/metabolite transporter, DME family